MNAQVDRHTGTAHFCVGNTTGTMPARDLEYESECGGSGGSGTDSQLMSEELGDLADGRRSVGEAELPGVIDAAGKLAARVGGGRRTRRLPPAALHCNAKAPPCWMMV